MTAVHQPSFSHGEVSPSMVGRVDLAFYGTALALCKNFVVQAQGGIHNRQGTRYVATVQGGTTAFTRLVPFAFSATESYVLEIGSIPSGSRYIRFYKHGLPLTYSNAAHGTVGNVVELTGMPWLPADLADLKFSQSADTITVTHPGYAPRQIQRYDDDKWGVVVLEFANGPFQSQNSKQGDSVSAVVNATTGAVTLTASSNIFKPEHSGLLFRMEPKDYGKAWEPAKTVAVGDYRRSDGKNYVAMTAGTTGTLRPIQTETDSIWIDGDAGVSWKFLDPGYGICRLGTIQADTNTVSATQLVAIPKSLASGNTPSSSRKIDSIEPYTGSDGRILIRLNLTDIQNLPTQASEYYVSFLYLTTSNGEAMFSNKCVGTLSGAAILLTWPWLTLDEGGYSSFYAGEVAYGSETGQATSTYRWSFGAWGEGPKWPACTCYFQQRQCFAGSPSQPQTVWMSKSSSYLDFGESTPLEDDDSLTYTLGSSQIDFIRNIVAVDKLALFTLGGNWVTGSGSADAVTPSNISAKLQSSHGAAGLAPLGVGNTLVYYGKGGTVRDFSYEFASDSYTGNDLTAFSKHLLESYGIRDWASQQSPFPVIWCVREDGVLLGLTYMKEQGVMGWHQHDLSGTVEQIAIINECNEDHIYMVVKRGSAKFIEVMYPRVDDKYEAYFLDCGGTYDGRNIDSTWTATASVITNWNANSLINITMSKTTFGGALPPGYPVPPIIGGYGTNDVGDHVVFQAASGSLIRARIESTPSTTTATATLLSAMPADLQGVATTSWALARQYISDIAHLNGQSVGVYADGVKMAPRTVTGGFIYLDSPSFVVSVGIPITAQAQTLPLTIPGQSGPALEKKKLLTSLRMILKQSYNLKVGPDKNHLDTVTLGSETDQMAVGINTGVLEAHIPASWNRRGSVFVEHSDPYPLSILGIIPDVVMDPGGKNG